MQFSHLDREVILMKLVSTNFIRDSLQFRMFKGDKRGLILQLIGEVREEFYEPQQDEAVGRLLSKFSLVFEEPKGLPPKCSHDHTIILKEGSQHVSVRPYMYVFFRNE